MVVSAAWWVGVGREVVLCVRGLGGVGLCDRNVGVAIGLVAGASCRCAGPEELAGPSVVPLVRSLVSECRDPAPDGSERMVFRVGRDSPPSAGPRETWEWR